MRVFRGRLSNFVCVLLSLLVLGGRMWVVIVLIPDHCLSIYFVHFTAMSYKCIWSPNSSLLWRGVQGCVNKKKLLPRLLEIDKFTTKYFILSKVYTDEGGLIKLCHILSACTGDHPPPLATASGLSSRTGKQTKVYLLFMAPIALATF